MMASNVNAGAYRTARVCGVALLSWMVGGCASSERSRSAVDAMRRDSGHALALMRVDGGAAANDLLMQFQSDILGVEIHRPEVQETTAMGAAYLAALGVGLFSDVGEVARDQKGDHQPESLVYDDGDLHDGAVHDEPNDEEHVPEDSAGRGQGQRLVRIHGNTTQGVAYKGSLHASC